MGQGYLAIILSCEKPHFIRTFVATHDYANGYKLMEHSYVMNNYVLAVESLIAPSGMFYKSPVVWGGDYADAESTGINLNTLCDIEIQKKSMKKLLSHK